MTNEEIKEGDIVEIDYIEKFTRKHINEGKALVIWKGFNHQPLVRKLNTKTTIWICYEHIARVVGHIDIEGYMDKALEQYPCVNAISKEAVDNYIAKLLSGYLYEEERTRLEGLSAYLWELPSVKPQRPSKNWIEWTDDYKDYVTCPSCGYGEEGEVPLKDKTPFCPICGEDLRGEQNE